MKKLLILLLSLILVFAFVSCGGSTDTPEECTEHVDEDTNGKCDKCGATLEVPKEECTEHSDLNKDGKCDICEKDISKETVNIPLIEDGIAKFRFVLASTLTEEQRETFESYVNALRLIGIYPIVVEESNADSDGCEVLIGNVSNRADKYKIDGHLLGKEGYAIKAIENKIVVVAGSDDSLKFAIEMFFEMILGVEIGATAEIDNVYLTTDKEIYEIQSDYSISDITVAGTTLKGRTIAVDFSHQLSHDMAIYIQDTFYTAIGAYLPIVPISDATDSSVIVRKVADDGEFGFKIFTKGNTLNFESGFDNRFEEALAEFINNNIKLKTGEIAFDSDYLYTKVTRIVTYEEFGARGDGYTDDFFAIKAAHDFANECGQTVVGRRNATYRIHDITDENGKANRITIRTNVDWTGVKFKIDDTDFTHSQANNSAIFDIASDYSVEKITNKNTINKIFNGNASVEEGFCGKLNWSDFGYAALIVVQNTTHRQYIRHGYDTLGSYQKELIVVDENGNIDKDTPFMWDYSTITNITIYRMDERHITVKGGEFTTIASNVPQTPADGVAYFTRRINITRSNTVIDGLVHLVTGELPGTKDVEGPKGAPYSGFLYPQNCSNLIIKNSVLTGRKYSGLHGTYDFQASTVNNLRLENVKQSNYFKDDGVTPTMDYRNYWGIGGTSYCKNMIYDNCLLSRYDAHEGLYNGAVINSTVCNMELIGKGEMLIENTTFTPISNTPIMLRGDYGCTWRGTITVKDCTINSAVKTNASLISTGWYNHYFGYVCYMPNIILDNLHWKGLTSNNVFVCSYAPIDTVHLPTLMDGSVNINPYMPPEYIKVINNNDGINYQMYDAIFYSKTKIEGISLLPSN